MRISDWSSDVCSSDLLDTANERLDRLEAAMSARGSTAAFDGVESAVIDELRLEEMRLRQTESQLLSTLGPRHPRVVTLRSELEKRRQQMLEEAQRLQRSEERREGKEWVSPCRARRSPVTK